jgi:hypothetical protein
LSAIFTILAFIMATRRFVFPRVLELTEEAILFPHGFPRTRITRILYADIIRVVVSGVSARAGFDMDTSRGHFGIVASYFKDFESYRAVKEFILIKAAIAMPRDDMGEESRRQSFPELILHWKESEEWPRYRTHLVVSGPLRPRLAKALWFFVRCMGFFMLPWLLLQVFELPTISTTGFLCVSIPAALFFTSLHWSIAARPARATTISVFDNGITQLSGKQTRALSYRTCTGWAVIERQFEGRTLRILLLQCRNYKGRTCIVEVTLPDTSTRDRLVQLFHDKQIPQLSDLQPSW